MNLPPEPDNKLLKSLVEETSALPKAAAAQARSRQRARMNTISIMAMLVVSALTAGIWLSQRTPPSNVATQSADVGNTSEVGKTLEREGYVKVHQAGETVAPDSIPPDATERERELLTELPDVPLLIVKNEAGQVARIHIFER